MRNPPNIIWILTDELGWGDLGCFGHAVIKMPSLDQLAREGCRLTRFYVTTPLCSPSRAGALTGRDPNRYGMVHVVDRGMVNPHLAVPEVHHLPVDEPVLPKVLQLAGYRTGAIGKWHLSLTEIESAIAW
ncbi:sulfatase family protein [Lacipirellula limnantheis]|uniref:sulfatase family protein n=1 Tax=Lacipirellula limnantheis TaxID=2528024 RepID=UPI00143DC5DB|nr:sulfatase-like hydrolase/transferase [Lacipirellula limnantheis]